MNLNNSFLHVTLTLMCAPITHGHTSGRVEK